MSQDRQLTWQMTIVMALSIVTFGGGTMALLILGRDVPGALWAIVGGLVNAIVSLGGFFNMRQMHAASLWHFGELVAHHNVPTVVQTTQATTVPTGSQES